MASAGAIPGPSFTFSGKGWWPGRRAKGASAQARAPAAAGDALHQDGSRHAWLEGGPALDLILGSSPRTTLDDATGAIYSAFLLEEEGTADLSGAVQGGVLRTRPADEPLHRSRGALFPHHQGRRDRPQGADPGRPGAGAIGGRAYRRLFAPGQGPLRAGLRDPCRTGWAKELALAGIASIDKANAFIREVYLPAHNQRFAVEATEPGSAFTPVPGVDLDEILCVQEERQVMNDNCVSYRTLKLQIPPSPMRAHFVKARVKVHVYPDGSHALFHGPKCIGRYDEKGTIKDAKNAASIRSASRPSWKCGQRSCVAHSPTRQNKTRRSGHLMCYQNRTS